LQFLSREVDGKPENGEDARLANAIRQDYPGALSEFSFANSKGLRLRSQYSASYEMIDWSGRELAIPRTKNDAAVHTPLNEDVIRGLGHKSLTMTMRGIHLAPSRLQQGSRPRG
jgi:hypothetical protein